MKYLLVFAFVGVMVWLWRHNREAERADRAERRAAAAPRRTTALATTEIVACQVCDVHLPRHEAVIAPGGAGGIFCSDAHRRQAQGR